jgi:hypothetical protein
MRLRAILTGFIVFFADASLRPRSCAGAIDAWPAASGVPARSRSARRRVPDRPSIPSPYIYNHKLMIALNDPTLDCTATRRGWKRPGCRGGGRGPIRGRAAGGDGLSSPVPVERRVGGRAGGPGLLRPRTGRPQRVYERRLWSPRTGAAGRSQGRQPLVHGTEPDPLPTPRAAANDYKSSFSHDPIQGLTPLATPGRPSGASRTPVQPGICENGKDLGVTSRMVPVERPKYDLCGSIA